MKRSKPVVLVLLDGWGVSEEKEYNAIVQADTPVFDSLWNKFPHTVIHASEDYVGLPTGQMGNSEIGHMTIGAGRILAADLVRISKAINDRVWEQLPALQSLFDHVKRHDATLHAVGLVSPGGVHSHQDHLHAFLKTARDHGIKRIAIHAVTDGRDTPPQSAKDFLKALEKEIEHVGVGKIATVVGRFYAMDRDNNWDRVAKAEEAILHGSGIVHQGKKPSEAVVEWYEEGVGDEYLEPSVFVRRRKQAYADERE